jgi:hypothetical protein
MIHNHCCSGGADVAAAAAAAAASSGPDDNVIENRRSLSTASRNGAVRGDSGSLRGGNEDRSGCTAGARSEIGKDESSAAQAAAADSSESRLSRRVAELEEELRRQREEAQRDQEVDDKEIERQCRRANRECESYRAALQVASDLAREKDASDERLHHCQQREALMALWMCDLWQVRYRRPCRSGGGDAEVQGALWNARMQFATMLLVKEQRRRIRLLAAFAAPGAARLAHGGGTGMAATIETDDDTYDDDDHDHRRLADAVRSGMCERRAADDARGAPAAERDADEDDDADDGDSATQ